MIRFGLILKYLGYILLFNALFLFISAVISIVHNESSASTFISSALITAVVGFLPHIFVEKSEGISFHEGLVISVTGWIVTCLVGIIPYYAWGDEFTLANAFFESVSGYTTTGASILNDVEALPKGLLFWRSATTFIGGVGIILFVLLILPEKKGIQSNFYRSEFSDLSKMSFQSRTHHIIRMIVTIYFSLIVMQAIILQLLGMTFFDAICHSFSTIATAGFSTKNLSIAAYDNIWIELVIMFFMLISSMNFGLIYATLQKRKISIFSSRTVRAYLLVIMVGIGLVTFQLAHEKFYSIWEALRYASFQVISLVSTTGLATVDTANWPIFSVIILIYFSIQCGMVGSTAGGVKFERVYLFFASFRKQLRSIIHPEGVYAIRIDKNTIDHNLELQIMVFIVAYLATILISTLALAAMGIDGITSFSACIATIGNVGPGFGSVSSLSNFGHLPDAAKYVLSANMLLGRLEIMNVLALFLMLFRKD